MAAAKVQQGISPGRVCLSGGACAGREHTSISFMSFMASIIAMVWPLVTRSPSLTKGGSPGAGERYIVPDMGDSTCQARTCHPALLKLTSASLIHCNTAGPV